MISISTTSSYNKGNVVIPGDFNLKENTARITRTKTLDGGVYIYHAGVSEGDRTLKIDTKISESIEDKLWYIFNNFTSVLVSIPSGIYLAAIKKIKSEYGLLTMTIYFKNKENN